MKPKSVRFRRLDGLRGVAAISVMVYHLIPELPFGLMGHGFLAVDLFFLLSGFVISYTYESRLRGGWPLAQFAIARAIRLYPLVFAAIGSVVLLRSTYPHPSLPSANFLCSALLNALLIPNVVQTSPNQFPIIGPTWSLFFEIVVNIAYAACITWLNKWRLIFTIVISGIYLILLTYQSGSVDILRYEFIGGMTRTVFSFSVGVWSFRNLQVIRNSRFIPSGIFCYIIMSFFIMMPKMPYADWLFEIIAILFAFPLVAFSGIRSISSPSMEHLEENLGEISYPIYLLHMPVAAYTGVGLGWILSGYMLSSAAVVFTVLASFAAWKLYDRPVRQWLNHRINYRRYAIAGLRAEP